MVSENHRKINPDWYNFVIENIRNGECINQEWMSFWDKVKKLRSEKQECKCDCNEAEPFGYCTQCWLSKKNPEWQWQFKNYGEFLCISQELNQKMKNYKDKDCGDNWWGITMTNNRGDIWETMREYFYSIQEGICPECEKKIEIDKMELHHKIAVNIGGRESSENLILLCKPCHHKHIMESIYD